MVDRYEQLLAQDPASTVFVELARAYLDRGDNEQAIAVCERGLTHHPDSVVARVLWGKALINVGRAAEAMRQFDAATSIDRDNPHAYNLISEALLRKGLYRSALPILKKAAALQPNDGRIAQWMEQTRAALAGGPAPELGDPTLLEPPPRAPPAPVALTAPPAPVLAPRAPAAAPTRPSSPPVDPAVFSALTPASSDLQSEPTEHLPAFSPGAPGPPAASRPSPSPPVPTEDRLVVGDPTAASARKSTAELPLIVGTVTGEVPGAEPQVVLGRAISGELPPAPDPFDSLGRNDFRAPDPTPSGEPAPAGPPPVAAEPAPPRTHPTAPAAADGPPVLSPAEPRPPKPPGLLADVPDSTLESPSEAKRGRPDMSTQATEAIAREYERELREKLEVSKQQKTFLQRHGLRVAGAAVLLVVALGLGGSFWLTRSRNQGETLDSALAKGLAGIAADTREQYLAAIRALEQARSMDEGNSAVLASLAYANAMLFAEHGRDPQYRLAALAALTTKVRAAYPAESLVVDFLVADEARAAAERQRLLDANLDKSLLHAHAGRVLLRERKYDEALARLRKAAELDPRQTLALVALGDYYLAFEDWDGALQMMARAEPLSRFNPERVLGHAEARLELGKELPEALAALEGLPANATIPPALKGRAALLLGRAQSANGRHEEALKTLNEGLATFGRTQAFAFQMALGRAERAAGRMDRAQRAYEEALKQQPRSEDAKEGLGRVLLARSRERELLDRLKPERDQRRVSLLRGIAWSRLSEPRKAREELKGTQVGGKVPAEAAVYLALADAAEESQTDKVVEMLERLAASRPRGKAAVQVALARVYLQRNQPDKAKAQLEEAAKDPLDYEANTLLGQLLLDAGLPPELALEPLQRAVEHNGSHAPARHLLTRALLAVGRTGEALHQVDAWTADNPGSDQAWKDAALVDLEAGKLDDAQVALARLSAGNDDVEAVRLRARVQFARGDAQAGMTTLEHANKLNPHDSATFCEIGHALVRQGNTDLAPKAYRKALEEDSKSACGKAGPLHAQPTARGRPSPREVVAALVTRATPAWDRAFLLATVARLALEEKDLKGAQAAAEEATTVAPASPPAWFALGEVRRRQKDDEQARAAYEKAAALDGSWMAAHLALADALARQGGEGLARAVAEYEKVAELDQNEQESNRARRAAAALKKQLR
jgi:cellulose synthase operon protein C